ncbi:hypothetical protein P8452_27206 [Trifolium repens]|nr:hypothetical protein P8452_27206 [Trifolium repens]
MASNNNDEGAPRGNKSGKRGLTRMPKIHKDKNKGIKGKVQWNADGQPIGDNSEKFVSYIGVITRRLIPLNTRDWRSKDEVLKTCKDTVWEKIQEAYVVGIERRHFVLREAGKLHNVFRTKVRKKHLRDSDGNYNEHPPREIYPHISQEQWDSFVAWSKSEKFQKLSKDNRERALDPEYPYRISRKGYARLHVDMKKEAGGAEPPLMRVWKTAHAAKNGAIDNDNVQKFLDKCEELAQTLPDEDVEDRGRNDILYQALDRPQYSGRVRARGFAVCPKDVFPPELPAAKQKTVDNIHAMYNRVIERLNILEREKEERQQASEAETVEREQPIVKCQQPEAVEREQPSVKDSCNPVDFDTIPKGISSIKIYVASPSRKLVARGKLHNTKGDMVQLWHGHSILLNLLVNVERSITNYKIKIRKCKGVLNQLLHRPNLGKSSKIKSRRLNATVINVYARYLYDKFISSSGLTSKLYFLSPHESHDDVDGNKSIQRILLTNKKVKDKIILAPFNFGKVHWALLVIDPDAGIIYYLDPMATDPTRHLICKKRFEK